MSNTQRPEWRAFASEPERFDLDALEANARLCDAKRARITREINLIRDRCQQRRLYSEAKARRASAKVAGDAVVAAP